MNGEVIKHAVLSARPVGIRGESATPLTTLGGLPPAGATAAGGAGRPTVIDGTGEKPRRLRMNKEERKRERRAEINAEIDDLLDDKPSKKKVRLYLLTRIQQLLEEKGLVTT